MKPMELWDGFKKQFDTWDAKVSEVLDHALRSPALLDPAAHLVTRTAVGVRRFGKLRERALATVGLATKADQERTLHLLNELQSRLMDLEEKLPTADKPETRVHPAHFSVRELSERLDVPPAQSVVVTPAEPQKADPSAAAPLSAVPVGKKAGRHRRK